MLSDFAEDVDAGLSASRKYLPSKYFYDARGDALFVKIMHLPEYYLTNAEYEIFTRQSADMIRELDFGESFFEIYELGAGDGTKTLEMLKLIPGGQFKYYPIDISSNALEKLTRRIRSELPEVQVEGIEGTYFRALHTITSEYNKVVLFLGSNIGNFMPTKARAFMAILAGYLNVGDKLLLGVDLKKSADIVLPAYNDSEGVTRDFNLNLLARINRELGGNFDLSKFDHQPEYNAEEGVARSFLVSTATQDVRVEKLGKTYHFDKGERIHTEVSRKFDEKAIDDLIRGLGMQVRKAFYDSRCYFADILIEKYA